MTRLAIVSKEDCKSKDCGQLCIKYCPVNLMNYKCITLDEKNKAVISENLCTGCGICVKKCNPWNALKIINLPENLDKDVTHRYSENSFKLHRLPLPRIGNILGLVGQNGSGKSTSLKILSGEIKLNLGKFGDETPDWKEIIRYFRGSELQLYFKKLSESNLKVSVKPQNIDRLPKVVKGVVKDLILKVDERGIAEELKHAFNLESVWERKVSVLSGGELQRLAIAAALAKDADAYFIDEPTSYLDIKERMRVAQEIRLLGQNKIVVVVEHDLAILDYLSDQVQLYYGESGAYGVVTAPMSVREGINVFLEGYIPTENMRFRNEPLKFKKTDLSTYSGDRLYPLISYGKMIKEYDTFKMEADKGDLFSGDIIGIIGPNGIGKSTFAKMIAGVEEPTFVEKEIELMRKRIILEDDDEEDEENEFDLSLTLSYKPQYLEFDETMTVNDLFAKIDPAIVNSAFFKTELLIPLNLEKLLSHTVETLSGGELQRVGIALCLSRDADLYIIDEPSAFISAEDRIMVGKTIRRMIMHRRATGIVIEHDLLLQSYISDRIIHFEGEPGVYGKASSPLSVKDGMNSFLKLQNITFRSDKSTGRPRINKLNSKLDKEQKSSGKYYLGT